MIWRNQNGKIIDDSYETIIEKQKNLSNSIIVRNRLEIIKIDRSYLLQEFRCEAFSSNIIMTNNISSSMLSNNSIIEINSNFSDDHRNRRISTSIIFDLNCKSIKFFEFFRVIFRMYRIPILVAKMNVSIEWKI